MFPFALGALGMYPHDMVQQFNEAFLAQEPDRRTAWLKEREEQYSKIVAVRFAIPSLRLLCL